MDSWRKKFDRGKWERAIAAQNRLNASPDEAKPHHETNVVSYMCWRCNEDERVWNGVFYLDYHSLPYNGKIYCPTCGKDDQVEKISRGKAEITWQH
ncbi:MAG: hypothetical protein K6T83_08180 [Alicyclobacillus sp.]|nr:hypothetical protein [Alicyclobacillus sp.]